MWERCVIRRIFGGRRVDYRWKRRENGEIATLYKEANIMDLVKVQRILREKGVEN